MPCDTLHPTSSQQLVLPKDHPVEWMGNRGPLGHLQDLLLQVM